MIFSISGSGAKNNTDPNESGSDLGTLLQLLPPGILGGLPVGPYPYSDWTKEYSFLVNKESKKSKTGKDINK